MTLPHILDRYEALGHRFGGAALGCVVLTYDAAGTWYLWLCNYCIHDGPRDTIRNRYADMLRGDWLEKFYR